MLNDPSVNTAIGALVETLINKALKHDPATRSKLTALQGCTLHIACEAPRFDLVFTIDESQVRVSAIPLSDADVRLSGKAGDFLSLVGEDTHSLANANITISGKVNILHQIKNALADLDVDWEDMLAQIIGVIPAHLATEFARATVNWGKQLQDAFATQLPDYLSEELKAVPSASELDIFYNAVDDIKSSTQRLEARLHDLRERSQALVQHPTI